MIAREGGRQEASSPSLHHLEGESVRTSKSKLTEETTMRSMTAWAMIVVLGLGFAMAGCQEKKEEPVAQAPVQQPVEKFPEAQVPPPEPQPPAAATSVPPAPPVDTTAEKPAATSGHKAKPQPKESYASGKKAARTYVVKKGDTLQKISEKFYQTTKNWRRICDANKKVIKNCDDLEPGTKLVIP
jgi:nucleoid-associated protein YgaU